jgi:hypothetical protein
LCLLSTVYGIYKTALDQNALLPDLFQILTPGRSNNFSTPIQATTSRYGTPTTSSTVGSHHALFNQGTGLIKQPAAPSHPPTIEIVAAGFLRLIHEQTVILLKAITAAARVNSRHAMNQRKGNPILSRERAISIFLPYDRQNLAEIALDNDGEGVGFKNASHSGKQSL